MKQKVSEELKIKETITVQILDEKGDPTHYFLYFDGAGEPYRAWTKPVSIEGEID